MGAFLCLNNSESVVSGAKMVPEMYYYSVISESLCYNNIFNLKNRNTSDNIRINIFYIRKRMNK